MDYQEIARGTIRGTIRETIIMSSLEYFDLPLVIATERI